MKLLYSIFVFSVRSCTNISEVIPDTNLKASCDSYTAGSTCSLSCNNNYVLDGDDLVKCEDDPTTSEIDVRWNFDNPSCAGLVRTLISYTFYSHIFNNGLLLLICKKNKTKTKTKKKLEILSRVSQNVPIIFLCDAGPNLGIRQR